MKADPNQLAAIRHGTGPALVTAGPGSGKTFVLTHRILYLIQILGVSPNQILVLTFSKKAATEMQERFEKLFPDEKGKVLFGTFHSVFLKILKKYSGAEIRVLSDNEKREIVKEVLRILSYPLKTSEFADELLREISIYKARGGSLDSYASKSVMNEEFGKIVRLYEELKLQNGGLDYEDILLRCRELIAGKKDGLQKRFRYILVDEFQDINAVQYELLYLLAGEEQNLFAVGDDDQSIYGFRGSNPAYMRLFLEDFKDCARYNLSVNYRCRQEIVSCAGNLITKNKNRLEKEIVCFDTSLKKAVFCENFCKKQREYDRVAELLRNMDVPGSFDEKINSVAILFRTNDYPEYLLNKLQAMGISYSCKAPGKSLFDRFVGKDILAYFRLVLDCASEEDCARILMNRISAKNTANCFADSQRKPFLNEYHKESMRVLDPFGAILYLRKVMGYDAYLENVIRKYPGREEEIRNDIENITGISRSFDSLEEWISNLRKEGKRDGEVIFAKKDKHLEEGADSITPCVQIMTFHASKGLEFDTVMIPDICEGSVPSPHAASDEEIEEERRLFYVGITRAKQHLYLFTVENKTERIAPSRFLKDCHLKYRF